MSCQPLGRQCPAASAAGTSGQSGNTLTSSPFMSTGCSRPCKLGKYRTPLKVADCVNNGSVSTGLNAFDSLRPATAPLASSRMLRRVPLEHRVENPRAPLGYTSEQPGISISPRVLGFTRSTTGTDEAGVKLTTHDTRC